MRKLLDGMTDHVIVCGAGRTGGHIVAELFATNTPCVVVDTDGERVHKLRALYPGLAVLVGDATEDATLEEAGIARASAVVATLSDDRENVYVTLSARATNPNLRIVAKVVDPSAEPKLRRAGADTVVAPNRIGGTRIASELLRPNVVEFLDLMFQDTEQVLRIEEATVREGSPVEGKTIGTVNLRKICDVLVLAARMPDGVYRFNPGAELRLVRGLTLVVMGLRDEVVKLRAAVRGDAARGDAPDELK